MANLLAITYGNVDYRQHNGLMSSLRKIGQNIAKIRREKGMTQEELAGLVEMDRSYLSEIENGHKNLSVNVLMKIAEVLEVNSATLLDKKKS